MPCGLAGRTPIVPGPAKFVKGQIECLLRRSNPHDIQNILNEGDKEALTEQLSGWNTLLSGTLARISDHLLTLAHSMHLIPDLNAASTALYDRDPFVSPQARLYLGDRRLRLTIKSLLTVFLRILKEKAVPQCFDLSRTVRYDSPS